MQRKRKGIFYWLTPVFVEIIGQLVVQGMIEFRYMSRFPENDISNISMYAAEITVLTALLLIPVMYFLYRRDCRDTEYQNKNRRSLQLNMILYTVAAAAALCVLTNIVIMISGIQNLSQSYMETAEALYSPTFTFRLVGIGIIVPIMEEMVFRILVYKRMRRTMGVKKAVIMSALVFGIMHGNLVQFVFAFAIGIMLAYLYEVSDHPLIPIVGHAAVNVTSLIFTEYHIFERAFANLAGFFGMLTVSIFVVMLSMKRIINKNK